MIYNFWGIIYYRIRICKETKPNDNLYNCYNLFLYGEKWKTVFGTCGVSHFISMPAQQAIKQFNKLYSLKLEQLVKTTVLSLAKTKELVDDLENAVNTYKQPPHDFARLVDYENDQRIMTIRLLLFLLEHESDYIFCKGFNENMKTLYQIDDTLTVDVVENKDYLKVFLELHKTEKLLNLIQSGIAFFDKIYTAEKNK